MKLWLWVESTKPKVFAASVAPVIVGSAFAVADGNFSAELAPLVLVCAILIQLVSNWVNDLYDYRRGADTHRVGPRRLLVDGLIDYRHLRNASWAAAVICFILGLPLVKHAGWPVLVIGVVCLIAAWAYTGGPWPLAYHGLGDAAAFLLFGVVGVCGTYFVHTGSLTTDVVYATIGPGLLVANILGVNNIRDIETDAAVGKRTLAVRIGSEASRQLYMLSTLLAVLLPSILLLHRGMEMMLPVAVIPAGLWLSFIVTTRKGQALNKALVGTSALYLAYAVLLAIAVIVAAR